MATEHTPVRTLSKREAELVGWLEAERRSSVSNTEVRETLGWSDSVTRNVLSRLAEKGWIHRTANGRYETVLADTGGWSIPNPWAALSTWEQRYYVGFKSAAYEHGLNPDRPGSVQICVPTGSKRPRAWKDIPIVLIFSPTFDEVGVDDASLHGFAVRLASVERVLVDGATRPARMGGVLGLARVVARSLDRVDWQKVVDLGATASRGKVGMRRIAALLVVLGHDVPTALASVATARPGESSFFLGEREVYGAHGQRLPQWQVVVNVDPSTIREEVRR